ncbi:MAG: hypothetical protein GAK35_02759 [Herbaspirillum frisingense]|uniref:Uncharacterized protein n=1 Tax=Herbaspirillum frisingense TaxID=92645 RepID=A0A7V8FVI9_9BURK|nr:MAG: hypothetical protein GAK35_02759 [Herbaspirillum frisingense]
MSSHRNKATAFQRPPKFNFLAARLPASRRDWPLGLSPTDAKRSAANQHGKRGNK